MSIHVALIDKSAIVQKMLSHCLYYFSAEVSRFDNFEDSISHFIDKKPDIFFVDWDIQQGDKAVIYSVIEKMKSTPVVLLYRSIDEVQINDIPSDKIPHRVKKPLDPKMVRDTLTELVSKAKESKIHPFLKFPKTTVKEDTLTADKKDNIAIPKADFSKDKKTQMDTFNIPLPKGSRTKEEFQTSLRQPLSKVSLTQTENSNDQIGKVPASAQSKSSKITEKAFVQKPAFNPTEATKRTVADYKKDEQTSSSSFSIQKTQSRIKMNKEDINIDENTKNDLAPMAIKSSISTQKDFLESQNFELNEEALLRVLNKYKDTLEFQEQMEKILSEYAKETVANILQDNKVTDLLRQPLNDFKESKKFKELVERKIIQYVNKNLPLVIKEVVEQEIKKILED